MDESKADFFGGVGLSKGEVKGFGLGNGDCGSGKVV